MTSLAEESEVQEAHQCVCYLKVSEETNFMDFSCNNPHCKFEGRFIGRKFDGGANMCRLPTLR